MAPFISIIIPIYNGEAVIRNCVESIKQQSFTNYEVVIIDGASTDNTVAIVKQYKDFFNEKMKIISESDNGVYDAMNKGIKLSGGEWVYFLGGDDHLIDSEVLMKVKGILDSQKERIDVFYGNVNSSHLGNNYDGEFDYIKICQRNICHQAMFYNRRVFDTVGLFNIGFKAFADYEFNLKCFFNSKIKLKHEDLVIAYFSEGGVSSNHVDLAFEKEKIKIIKKLGYKFLPLKDLKYYCDSRMEVLKLMFKRIIG